MCHPCIFPSQASSEGGGGPQRQIGILPNPGRQAEELNWSRRQEQVSEEAGMRIRILFTVALLGWLATSSSQALTYVHVSDSGLTEQAEVIARVEVIESRVVTTGRQISTLR